MERRKAKVKEIERIGRNSQYTTVAKKERLGKARKGRIPRLSFSLVLHFSFVFFLSPELHCGFELPAGLRDVVGGKDVGWIGQDEAWHLYQYWRVLGYLGNRAQTGPGQDAT